MLRDDVLFYLEQSRDRVVTGGELARDLGVSRTAVWKAVGALKESGHEIESLQGAGYRLGAQSDGLSAKSIQAALQTSFLGRSLEILESTASTNTYIRELNTASLPEGHTVIADGQTGGKGRRNRVFASPAREGLYMSVLLKPVIPLLDGQFLTLCAAVAVCEALEEVYGFSPDIKWINDIYYRGKKLCGILTEASVTAEMQSMEYAVVGIGINTGQVAGEVRDIATSTLEISGKKGLRNVLAATLLFRLESVYLDYTRRKKKQEILDAYAARLFVTGKEVLVTQPGGEYTGTVLGVDDTGALLVKPHDGDIVHLSTGEISLLK